METKTRKPVKRFLKYALIGPVLGLAIIDVALVVSFAVEFFSNSFFRGLAFDDLLEGLGAFIFINIFGLIYAYLIGIVPAVLAGLAALYCDKKQQECAASAMAGASPFLLIFVIQLNEQMPYIWLLLALLPASSAVLCAMLFRRNT